MHAALTVTYQQQYTSDPPHRTSPRHSTNHCTASRCTAMQMAQRDARAAHRANILRSQHLEQQPGLDPLLPLTPLSTPSGSPRFTSTSGEPSDSMAGTSSQETTAGWQRHRQPRSTPPTRRRRREQDCGPCACPRPLLGGACIRGPTVAPPYESSMSAWPPTTPLRHQRRQGNNASL